MTDYTYQFASELDAQRFIDRCSHYDLNAYWTGRARIVIEANNADANPEPFNGKLVSDGETAEILGREI